MKDAHKERI